MRLYSIFHLGEICLVTIQEEINDKGILSLLRTLSSQVKKRKSKAVIVDLGDVDVIDTFLAENIQRLANTMRLFKVRIVITGLRAHAIAALKSFEMSFGKGLLFALDTEQALQRLGYKIVKGA